MLHTVPPELLIPLSADGVRWHYHPEDHRDGNAVEATCHLVADLVRPAWETVAARAAATRADDPALHRLMVNLHLEGLDLTADGIIMSLYVDGRGTHDLLHAATGQRMTEALTQQARTPLRVADCASRLRWTRNIHCHEHAPVPVPPDADAEWAHQARLQDVIDGRRPAGTDDLAPSQRLLLALRHRLGISLGAQWAGHPAGMVTLRVQGPDARRLLALGIPARARLEDKGADVAFTLTAAQCNAFADTIAAAQPA
ncbi:hypothetical protein ACFC0S_15675 [Streptomyces sp. NPDC056084]|uniref:hypothetical protein n=1 Tax=unclassified Streptomyces TaxID=2593676 RepID=UPI0035D61DE8